MDRFRADVVIDLQAGTGVQHGYYLTYDISHHPAKDIRLDQYLRGQLLPEVTGRLARLNLPVFYTGQFDQVDQARIRWLSVDQRPGSLSQYLTLRGRIGIVCQANPQASAESRFVATTAFLRETFRRLALDKDHLRPLLVAAQNGSKPGESIPLTGMREKAEDVVRVLATIDTPDAKVVSESKSNGQSDQRSDVATVQELRVQLWNQTSIKSSVVLPVAYAIPLRESWLVSRLESHGVPVKQLKNSTAVQAETAIVQELKSLPIELGRTGRNLIVQWQKSVETLAAGTFLLQTSGPWGRLIAQLLEPESDECLASWGYFDPYLKQGERYPVVRLNQMPDSVRPVGKVPSGEELSLQNIFEPESALKIAGQHSLNAVAWIESSSDDEYAVERDKRWVAISARSGQVRELVEMKQLVDRLMKIDPTAEEKAWSAVRRTKFWLNSHRYVPLLLLDRLYVYDRTSNQ
ncbi:MAG TPA: hypothetical protein DCF63_00590 [Planctomycetaceae bacterium]|nr:hypothetical protein [Planctomycetaceae bacterium]